MTEAQTIARLRSALRMQKAWLDHWKDDVRHNLRPTLDSLHDATDQIDEALRETREATHA